MNCYICHTAIPRERNFTVCSEKCLAIHSKRIELAHKYFKTNGCTNCWGDLHGRCTETCQRELHDWGEFLGDIMSLIRIVYPKTEDHAK